MPCSRLRRERMKAHDFVLATVTVLRHCMQSKRHASAAQALRRAAREARKRGCGRGRVLDIIDVGGLRSGDPAAVARVATAARARLPRHRILLRPQPRHPGQPARGHLSRVRGRSSRSRQPQRRQFRSSARRTIAAMSASRPKASIRPTPTTRRRSTSGSTSRPPTPRSSPVSRSAASTCGRTTPGFRDTALSYFDAVWRLGCDLHLGDRGRSRSPARLFRRQVRPPDGDLAAAALSAARCRARRAGSAPARTPTMAA